MRRLITALAAALVSAACGGPGPSGTPAQEPDGTSSSSVDPASGFELSAIVEGANVTVADEITVFATLGHDRPGAVPVWGSGSGLVGFSVEREEDGLGSGPPIGTSDCASYEAAPGAPTLHEFTKSGGYAPGDPNAGFIEFYQSEEALHLPAGTWRIDASATFTIGEGCTRPIVHLVASVEVVVTED